MHYLYILYSKVADRYYVGETPDLDIRLPQHTRQKKKKGFTKAASDWDISLSKKCDSKTNALYLEKFIKRMKSRKFIEKIIADPTILDDIMSKMLKCPWFPRSLGAGGTTNIPAIRGVFCF